MRRFRARLSKKNQKKAVAEPATALACWRRLTDSLWKFVLFLSEKMPLYYINVQMAAKPATPRQFLATSFLR
jgi:hypothetical protein